MPLFEFLERQFGHLATSLSANNPLEPVTHSMQNVCPHPRAIGLHSELRNLNRFYGEVPLANDILLTDS